jgi:hypothetical protein
MKEIQNKGELKSQSGLPYDPTVTGKNEKGEPYTFIHTKEDTKFKKYFSDMEQWETFVSLPLTEPQRIKLISKLQGKLGKEKQLQKENEQKEEVRDSEATRLSYADVVKKNLTQK